MKDAATWWAGMICYHILDQLISLNPLSIIYILRLWRKCRYRFATYWIK